MGIGATRELDRVCASLGLSQQAEPIFHPTDNVCNAGVLFLLPALISQGLLKATAIYDQMRKGYYGFVSILLLLAYMYLSRIKCPEQLKMCKPGELGKLLGLDRVPEAKCLRSKIEQIVNQQKATEFGHELSQQWIKEENTFFFYVDGHVRVYHGKQANLPKRFVSREKLCLAGTTESWVNNELGLPYLVVFSELNEKLQNVILSQIVPALIRDTKALVSQDELDNNKNLARFALVFDREAYDIPFFKKLWDKHRIAVLTYRKGVKDLWNETDFKEQDTSVIGKKVVMQLAEKKWVQKECEMREIRKLSENGHQTSIATTLRQFDTGFLAGKMFSRWSQENFFRYMMQDYDIDKMTEYGIEEVDPKKNVVNPSHRKLTYNIKKQREKLGRLQAKLLQIIEIDLDKDIDSSKKNETKLVKLFEDMNGYRVEIEKLCKERKNTAQYIEVADMPVDIRYNKLKVESKLFMNTIRMICYRAETAVANLLEPYCSKATEEIRMLVKEIINSDADIIPDNKNKTLTVRLHSLSTPRANNAAKELCGALNETETIYPGTCLRLIYETVKSQIAGGQEV